MKSQIFKFGGGAGIGSYVIVWENGQLVNPQAEKIRGAYDNGDNLYLSIIDDGTEEALLPLSGYVDNEGILHLSGRDFDDNKTYEFEINGNTHEITTSEVEGITMGEGTIPSEGGSVDVPGLQATATLVKDALTNLNGRVLSAYEATDGLYADLYPIKTITYGGETCTEEQARNYMEYMTGSRFLPVYNYEKPQNSMWIMSDGTFWKPQFDENNGLILFQIPSLFALKSEAGTKLYKHELEIDGLQDSSQSDVGISFNIVLINNDPTDYSRGNISGQTIVGYFSNAISTKIVIGDSLSLVSEMVYDSYEDDHGERQICLQFYHTNADTIEMDEVYEDLRDGLSTIDNVTPL